MNRRTFSMGLALGAGVARGAALEKEKDIVIYQDDSYYCAFPSVVRRKDGELVLAFRRAPNRRLLGESRYTHTDSNSYLVLVRSRDGGMNWTKEPELIAAHPLGGSQDPCLVQLRDGTLLCASYLWSWLNREAGAKTAGSYELKQFVFQGGYLVRSTDGGKHWSGPEYPPPVPGRDIKNAYGKPLPVYNRGALYQAKDGRLHWVIAYPKPGDAARTDVHLMTSADGGRNWKYSCPVATDPKADFNESCIYETPKGDLVSFIRTARMEDHTVLARSRDGGKTFEPWQDLGWQGHPHHAIRLEDNRVLLVYGYRHKPYGIRARILDPECTNAAKAEEFIIREDGGTTDLGYPWAVALPGKRVLVTYYYNLADGLRHIAGSVLKYS